MKLQNQNKENEICSGMKRVSHLLYLKLYFLICYAQTKKASSCFLEELGKTSWTIKKISSTFFLFLSLPFLNYYFQPGDKKNMTI